MHSVYFTFTRYTVLYTWLKISKTLVTEFENFRQANFIFQIITSTIIQNVPHRIDSYIKIAGQPG